MNAKEGLTVHIQLQICLCVYIYDLYGFFNISKRRSFRRFINYLRFV